MCFNKNLPLKELKPIHVLLFVLGVFLVLSPIVAFIPKNGWDLGFANVHFLTQNDFFKPVKQEKKDISKIVAKIDTSNIEALALVKHKNGSNGTMGAPDGGVLSTEAATKILFSEQGQANLERFFEKLKHVANNKSKIHILHYGDSQIEGDRMTAYIRQRMQNQFGGNGPGLIPAMNVYNTITFKQTYSENFKRYTCFGGPKLKNKKYGVMASSARFTAELDSVTLNNETAEKEAWIEIEPGKSAYSRAKQFSMLRMFYTNCVKPCGIKVFQNGTLIHEDSLVNDSKAHTFELSFATTPGKLRFQFNSIVSPTINGFSLEGDFGVQVSNIGMRGSSGTIFGSIDHAMLSKQYNELNAELFIMQFGGNAVPAFKDSSSVRNFARYFRGQLNTIKKIRPSATIIVIGPSDMSKLDNGIFITYPLLPYCVEQMKKVALETGSCYWDLFGAMGGLNSMPAWVEQGLAGKDYIHFSNKGASIASQLFFDAFAAEYAKWDGGKTN